MPTVTPALANAHVLIVDHGDRHHERRVYLCIEDADGNEFRYEVPGVVEVSYTGKAHSATATLSLLRVGVEVKLPIGTGAQTTVEELLVEIAAASLTRSKS